FLAIDEDQSGTFTPGLLAPGLAPPAVKAASLEPGALCKCSMPAWKRGLRGVVLGPLVQEQEVDLPVPDLNNVHQLLTRQIRTGLKSHQYHKEVSDRLNGTTAPAMLRIATAPSRSPSTYRRFQTVRATAGDTVRLLSRLSPNISAPVREIRWFKGADCVKVFQISGGEEAAEETPSNGRDVSLTLYDVKVTDSGQYRCEMLGDRKEDILFIHLHVSEFRLVLVPTDVGKPSRIQPLGYKSRGRNLPDFRHRIFFGDATLPCYLSPETSAAAMEIRWFKGTDWIYLYQNGQVTEGRGYEGRVSLFTHELQKGNVSLRLRDTQKSDSGRYRCVVTHGDRKVKTDVIHFTVGGTEKTFLRRVNPALICEKHKAPVADLPILVFCGKCLSRSTVLASDHRAHYRRSGPQATLM
ncbi:hypothetical protein NFI96_029330, partial [Prochilodus magdalenae]